MGLVLYMQDVRAADILLKVGSRNTTTTLVVSLWQQMKLLQGLVPTYLQVYLTPFTHVHSQNPAIKVKGKL